MDAPIGYEFVDFLNEELGDDVSSLKRIKELYKKTTEAKNSIEKQLSLASSEVPSEIETAIHEAEDAEKCIRGLGKERDSLRHSILDHVRHIQPMVDDVNRLVNEVEELEKYIKYLTYVARVEEISSQIQASLLTESMSQAVDAFTDLCDLHISIYGSSCVNLLQFVNKTILFWYKLLKDKIAVEFEEVLKNMRWPFIAMSIKALPTTNPSELKASMEVLFKQLLKLHLPDGISVETQDSASFSHAPGLRAPVLPLQIMLNPLRKRFRFHFYGRKQTNSLEKPEWFFTQVLSWIRDHSDFLEQRIQPLLDQTGRNSIDARIDFMRGLVALVMDKVEVDLKKCMYDEHLFSHLIDEALLFDRELHSSLGYPSSLPGCLFVLTKGEAFEKWILVEKKFAVMKMDTMLSSPSAWHSQYKDIADVDDLKVPECGESFVTLMLTITDRYKHLPQASHKLYFLELQLDLLDDFRIRLIQVMKDVSHDPLGQCFCSIMNTVYYMVEVLGEWSELLFFLQLQYYKLGTDQNAEDVEHNRVRTISSSSFLSVSSVGCQLTQKEESMMFIPVDGTVFEDVIELFDRMKLDMLKTLVSHVFTDVKARSQSYRKDKWISMPSVPKKEVILGLSVTACEMFLVLKDHLMAIFSLLSKPLFSMFWQKLAEKLNRFIYDEVIIANHFSDGGITQLNFDMNRNLFPLFGEHTQKPESHFRDVKEACLLLTLNKGSAILLKETLNRELHSLNRDKNSTPEDMQTALHEIGIFKLTAEQTELILSLRMNLSL